MSYELKQRVTQQSSVQHSALSAGRVAVSSLFSQAVFMATKVEARVGVHVIFSTFTICCHSRCTEWNLALFTNLNDSQRKTQRHQKALCIMFWTTNTMRTGSRHEDSSRNLKSHRLADMTDYIIACSQILSQIWIFI